MTKICTIMALTFREAKTQLGAASIGEIKTVLDQLQRPITEPISTEDFEVLRGLYPLLKQGMSLPDAIALYNESQTNEPAAVEVPQEPPIMEMLETSREDFIASNVESSLRKDVKAFYLLYFQAWGDALKSPEILQDDEVRAACKGAISSTLEVMQGINDSFLGNFKNRLRTKGFLPGTSQPQLGEALEVEIKEVA